MSQLKDLLKIRDYRYVWAAQVAAAAIGVRNVFLVSGIISGVAGVLAWVMLKGVAPLPAAEPVPESA